nr:proton-conducting transporter membrane subunit [Faecalibaculum rodentium]
MLPVRADIPEICGMGLHFTLDGFRALYGMIAAFMWFMSTLFSREYLSHYRNRNRYYLFLLVTLGATEGVFLSADFYTTFIFFEIMSLTSYVWVAHDEKREALRAAGTYLAVAVIGGLVMLMGIFLLYDVTGTDRKSVV